MFLYWTIIYVSKYYQHRLQHGCNSKDYGTIYNPNINPYDENIIIDKGSDYCFMKHTHDRYVIYADNAFRIYEQLPEEVKNYITVSNIK